MKWFDCFNSHDLNRLLSLYDEMARHYSPKLKARQPHTNGWISGRTALRQWWQDAFTRLPDLRYELTRLTADDDQVFMEYQRHVNDEPVMSVGEVLEIKNGLIVQSRVYHG